MNSALNFVFSKVPILRALDGYKRKAGNVLIVAALTLAALHQGLAQQFPALDITYLNHLIAYVGVALRVIGDAHAQAKTER